MLQHRGTFTVLMMAVIVATAPTYASGIDKFDNIRTVTSQRRSSFNTDRQLKTKGSCLSYGHSCWGAHGKRSGGGGGGADEGRWILSRLAPITGGLQQQRNVADAPPQWKQIRASEQQRISDSDSGEGPLVISEETDIGRDEIPVERPLVFMEQPPRLYKILNSLPRSVVDLKSGQPLK